MDKAMVIRLLFLLGLFLFVGCEGSVTVKREPVEKQQDLVHDQMQKRIEVLEAKVEKLAWMQNVDLDELDLPLGEE